ncbi:Homocitrate synthase [Venustampulla echinocandica]|uniref:Homocitrate synthase n=1 Tax=Venustampulla echinocandica TaxID=2656787 RepID=A0A370U0H3_9HELO|nr:Homocitrate synthase [Venustampulla echinocandica]RDL41280.1 Homocitrate synthase [Venustampulla echinocandica]
MRVTKWVVPVLLRLLSLSSLTSAGGGSEAKALVVGFALSASSATATTATTGPQPRPQDLSLELDFFLQVANHELRVPIMPLHLLGKKSWNVYNQDNIAKVKRDEAAAKAKEEAEEQRMQEIDADRRMQLLRGEIPTPIPDAEESNADDVGEKREGRRHERKRRKKAGENDTDFEMRIAHEQTASSNAERQIVLRKPVDAPLVDHRGHIDLFPQERERSHKAAKNEEAEKEAAKKKKEYEDQYTMRFSNAAGFKQSLDNPWYSKTNSSKEQEADGMPGKDVWGNEDPRRKEREAARIVSNDPLAMMRQGAAQVRQVEKERRRWREEKEKEMQELEAEERRRKRKRRHRDKEDGDEDDLEDFNLDAPEKSPSKRKKGEHSRAHRHESRHRDSSLGHSHRDEDRRRRHKHRRRD